MEPNTVDDYDRTFSTEWGQRVLANMLTEGGFFKHNHTPEEQAVQNFLKTVLSKTGRYPVEGMSPQHKMVSYISGIGRVQKKNILKRIFTLKKEY
jgi:hypothetical protein